MSSFDWGAVIGAAASLYGAKKGADAAKSAGNQQAASTAEQNALLKYFYDQDVQRQQPFYNNAITAQNQYMQLMGLGQGGNNVSSWFGSGSRLSIDSRSTSHPRGAESRSLCWSHRS